MTRAQMMSTMSAKELMEWQIYYSLEPFGEEKADWRMGMICATILNSNRISKQDKVWKPEDFMPKFYDTKPTKGGFLSRAHEFENDYNLPNKE